MTQDPSQQQKTKSSSSISKIWKENKNVLIPAAVVAGAAAYSAYYYWQLRAQSKAMVYPKHLTKGEKEAEMKDDCKCASSSSCSGIPYATPMDAFRYGQREKILYTTATRTTQNVDGGDFVAVVDVDPSSDTYCQIISQVHLGKEQELHHSGWNACASCFGQAGVNRNYLVCPGFRTGDIHFIDVSNPRNPVKHKTVSGAMVKEKFGLSFPHTVHCLANGKIMISYLGVDKQHPHHQDNHGVDFLWFNAQLEPECRWVKHASERPLYGYDYWYQPYHNVMISTEWGTPDAFSKGFQLSDVADKLYGTQMHIWDWQNHTLIKTLQFEAKEAMMPLEVRFVHEPKGTHAFCGAALTSNIIHIWKTKDNDWQANAKYITVEPIEMTNWALPNMPGLVTDILLSMDDRFLYFSNWLHGDIRQYDISNPDQPVLHSQCFVGGLLRDGSGYDIKDQVKNPKPLVANIKGKRIEGGPQMLQLSLDGRRLYVTNSLYTPFDQTFYPEMVQRGGQILCIDIDLDNDAKMKLNTDFLVDFGQCQGGPARPHEMRYPGGDCTSDIFVVQ